MLPCLKYRQDKSPLISIYVRGVAASARPANDPSFDLPVRYRLSCFTKRKCNLGIRDYKRPSFYVWRAFHSSYCSCSAPRSVAYAEKEDLPQLRVGLAAGSAVRRAGDWFGSPVNLASRVTGVHGPARCSSPSRRVRQSVTTTNSPGLSPVAVISRASRAR